MPTNDQISSRIDILRFPLIVGVVFIHNYNTTIPLAQGSMGVTHNSFWVEFVRFFISEGIARVAVPLFFLISGYLFFLGDWSPERYVNKLQRRLHTLLIPFIFWNLLTLAAFAIAQSIPATKLYFAATVWQPIYSFSFSDYANALFGIAVPYPIATQFWFIRDLMALVVLAPVIHLLLTRKLALPFTLALFCLWFFSIWPVLWPAADASFFFCLGACLSRPGKILAILDKLGPWISVTLLGLLILYSTFPESKLYLDKLVIVVGAPSFWWLTGLAIESAPLKSFLTGLSGASFFVFAAHEPLLMIIRKLSYKLLSPTGGMEILALYFLIPAFLIAFLVIAHRCLLKAMPSFIGVVTGSSFRPVGARPR